MTEHKSVQLRDYTFSYIEKGEGEIVLFVHGSCLDYRYWTHWVDRFSDRYRAIALNRRHHWPDVPNTETFNYSVDEQVLDTIRFIEEIAKAPVHLIGHSYGGYIAARIACERPDLLSSLVLVEPGGPIEGQQTGRSLKTTTEQTISLIKSSQMEAAAAHFFGAIDTKMAWTDRPQDLKNQILDNLLTIPNQFQEDRPIIGASALQDFRKKTLLMLGQETESPFPEAIGRLAELLPHARLSIIEGASHMVDLDNPETFQSELENFLNSVPPGP